MPKPIKKILNEFSYLTGYCLTRPEFLTLLLTHRCNFRCRSCYIWRKEDFIELGRREWLAIAEQIKKIFPASTFIEINGGEALLKKNLTLEIIRELKKKFPNVTLNSNGSLITSEMLYEIKQAGLTAVKLSLYSLNEEVHDELRGQKLAGAKVKRALKLLNDTNIKTEVAILVTRYNIATLPELINYLNNLDQISIIIQPLDESIEAPETKNLSANFLPLDLWPDKEQVNDFFDWLKNHSPKIKNSTLNLEAIRNYYLNPKSALAYRCFAGQRNLIIYPNGEVALCFKNPAIGNLKQKKLGRIISSSRAASQRRRIKNCGKYCRIIGCNFSRGIKEIMNNRSS